MKYIPSEPKHLAVAAEHQSQEGYTTAVKWHCLMVMVGHFTVAITSIVACIYVFGKLFWGT